MRVLHTVAEMRAARASLGELGLVPTMGFLHEGHLSLVARAKTDCATVAASIFVNPTQFGPSEDLSRYPRDLPRDLNLLEAAGVGVVFVPDAAEMYPPGFDTHIEIGGITAIDFGPGIDRDKLPHAKLPLDYAGREPGAAWRKAAEARIEKYRKGTTTATIYPESDKAKISDVGK